MAIDDQMWAPIQTHPCGCVRGTSARCAVHDGGPGVFDVMAVTGWRPTDPQPSTVVLSDADVERIARRVAELMGPRIPTLPPRRPYISPALLEGLDDEVDK